NPGGAAEQCRAREGRSATEATAAWHERRPIRDALQVAGPVRRPRHTAAGAATCCDTRRWAAEPAIFARRRPLPRCALASAAPQPGASMRRPTADFGQRIGWPAHLPRLT